MSRFYSHLAARVFGEPLLIRRRKLGVILGVIGPRIGLQPGKQKVFFDDEEEDDENAPSTDKPYVVTDDGIAVINISGALVRKSSWISAYSGLRSYVGIEQQFLTAVADPAVAGILLDIDSPGGEAGGCFDLVDQMYAQRGKKPIYAIADDAMYSGAYAIGSVADKLFCTRTGGVGSVGVIYLHIDQSGADTQEGLKYTAIFSGDRKNDFSPHEPLSETAYQIEKAECDRIYDMFVQTVARNRGMSSAAVRGTEAGLFYGPNAVASGLADEVGTYADAMKALIAALPAREPKIQPIFQNAGASAAANSNKGEPTLMSEEVQPADQPAAPAAAAIAPTGATAKQKSEYGAHHALETMHLCALGGKGLKEAISFVESRTSLKNVRKQLAAERLTENEKHETTSAVLPASSTAAQTKPEKGMAAYVEEQNAKRAGAKGVH